jgi:hypothetical protein
LDYGIGNFDRYVGAIAENLICGLNSACKLTSRKGAVAMRKHRGVAVSLAALFCMLMLEARTNAETGSRLPDPVKAGFADRLYRLDCGHSLANDESVWTPGENVGRHIQFSSTSRLIKHGGLFPDSTGDTDVFGDGSVTLPWAIE